MGPAARRAIVLLLAGVLVACTGRSGAVDSGEPGEDPLTRARIVNRENREMRVHLVVDGHSSLLGVVPARGERLFELRETRLGTDREVRFRAEAVGGLREWRSDELYVPPGETVRWVIGGA